MGLHFLDGLAWDAPAKRWRIRVQVAGKIRKGSAPTKAAATAFRDGLLVQRSAARLGLPVPAGLPPSAPLLAVWSRRAGGARQRHPLTPWTLQRALCAASEAAGLGRAVRGLGWLRNQALTLAGETGASVEVLRRAAGHTTSAVTERHYDQSRRWGARETLAGAVDEALDGPGTPVSAPSSEPSEVRFAGRGVPWARVAFWPCASARRAPSWG